MRHTYPEHGEAVVNLLGHYEAATPAFELEGAAWYPSVLTLARDLAAEHGGDPRRPAGIIAALSPQVQWGVNRRMAVHLMTYGEPGEGCLRLSDMRARRIWEGEAPLDVLGGDKTRAFYRAIVGDLEAVVLDTWMSSALGRPHGRFSPRQYERGSSALREAAQHCGLAPATFQAIVWTTIRGGGD